MDIRQQPIHPLGYFGTVRAMPGRSPSDLEAWRHLLAILTTALAAITLTFISLAMLKGTF